jgi:MraZ protein
MPKEGTPVIEGCDRAFVDELVARAYSPTASEDARERIQLLLGEMMTLSVDPEGRFVLPAPFRAHAALQDSAVFVGRGRTFEIWSPARYAEAREQRKARVGGESLSLNSAFFLEPPKS